MQTPTATLFPVEEAEMRWLMWSAVPLLGVAGCTSTDSSDAAGTASPATTTAPVSTRAPSTTASATTGPLATTLTPETTEPPTGSAAPDASNSIEVSFSMSSAVSSPVVFAETSVGVHDDLIESTIVHAELAGDFAGTLTRSTITNADSSLSLEWFEGRVAECGVGALAIRTGTRPDGTTGWEVVAGLGVGDLADATGKGTMSTESRYDGTVRCHGAGDPMSFSSTILQPVPDAGTETGVPQHISQERDEPEVPVHPDQVMAPKVVALSATYDVWLARGTHFWMRDDVPTVMRSEFLGFDFLDDVCGHPGVVRIMLDDFLLPPYRGGWDLPPELNQGAYGAGRFDADTNVGRIVCPS